MLTIDTQNLLLEHFLERLRDDLDEEMDCLAKWYAPCTKEEEREIKIKSGDKTVGISFPTTVNVVWITRHYDPSGNSNYWEKMCYVDYDIHSEESLDNAYQETIKHTKEYLARPESYCCQSSHMSRIV